MTATIIPFTKKEPQCSFCSTPKSKAKKMVVATSGKVAICDKCLATCTALITEKESA